MTPHGPRLLLGVLAAALGSYLHAQTDQGPTSDPASLEVHQVGYPFEAEFILCAAFDCPARSVKTFAVAQASTPALALAPPAPHASMPSETSPPATPINRSARPKPAAPRKKRLARACACHAARHQRPH